MNFRLSALPSILLLLASLALHTVIPSEAKSASPPVLQRLHLQPTKLADGTFYVSATLSTSQWGYLPTRQTPPILTVPSGSVVTFDTLSGEGMMEDQGRDPVNFWRQYGVDRTSVLDDAIEIAASDLKHDFNNDGPHIIIGPVAVEGAQPGDVLKVDMIAMTPRVPYGLVANDQGKGTLPGEYPQKPGPLPGAGAKHPELYNDVFTFVPVETIGAKHYGIMRTKSGKAVRFPLAPFIGTMGVTPNTDQKTNSVRPSNFGGNLDLKELTVGSSLYLPIQVPGAMYFIGDPHFAQGDGEVALTAVEASLRAKVRLTLLKQGDKAIPSAGTLEQPFAETPDYWIAIGLDEKLDEALKNAVRAAIKFLVEKQNMDAATAFAYLSAASDFHVTQAVDITKGIHGLIRKADFSAVQPVKVGAVLPLSGGVEAYGNQAKIGLTLAAKQINESGGILGRPLELIVEDDKTNPDAAIEATRKLVEQDAVTAIVGPITSQNLVAMEPYIERLKVPLLYATNYEGGACSHYIFSLSTVPNQELTDLLPYMSKTFGNTFFLLGADHVWPHKMFEASKPMIQALGGHVVGEEYTKGTEKDFTPLVKRVAASKAKVLLFALKGDGLNFINQAQSQGLLKQTTIAFLGLSETDLPFFGGKAQNMFVVVPMVASSGSRAVKEFVAKAQSVSGANGPVSNYVMTHYNALMALKAAIEKSGTVDKEPMINAMEGLTIDSITGPVTIGKNHHSTMNLYLAKAKGNNLVIVRELGRKQPQPGCK
jgi:urea transport system substrate-binding protein